MIPQRTIDWLLASPYFMEWLHGGGDHRGPIKVPVTEGSPYDLAGQTVRTEIVDLVKWWAPAPWAVWEYRYVCNVATCGGQEIARSECWRWFNPVSQMLTELPRPEDDLLVWRRPWKRWRG